MSVLTELLVFSMDREPWQQDMIRRLYTQATLTAADVDGPIDQYQVSTDKRSGIQADPSPAFYGLLVGTAIRRCRIKTSVPVISV
jgi:hypothetical protein